MIDAQTALDWVLKNPELKEDQIVVYGQSLGGALAIQLVAKNESKVGGLMLVGSLRVLDGEMKC